MTRSLRRSRRAPKKNSDYNVGDIVEITRAGVVLHGRLAQLLTEGTSPNPRWLLKFDGQPHKDEEMYERSFGRLVASYDDDEPNTRSKSPPPPPPNNSSSNNSNNSSNNKPHKPHGRRGSNSKNSSASSDDELKKAAKAASKRAVQFSEGSNVGSDYSSTPETSSRKSARDKVSAREERSRRRQAKIDEEVPIGEVPAGAKRRAPPTNQPKKRQRGDNDGEVVKVKLLTGTLFLYKNGLRRRAEFIRRV